VTGKISINITKKTGWAGGLEFILAFAPGKITVETAGKDVGDIRYNPTDKTCTVSLGQREKVNLEAVRRAGGAIAKWILKNDQNEVGIDLSSLPEKSTLEAPSVGALVEGLLLGSFAFEKYKTSPQKSVCRVHLLAAKESKNLKSEVEKAVITSEAVNLSREWAHEPPNIINPVSLTERVQKLAVEAGLKFRVLDDKQLEKMGAGAMVAVGKGSATPSRLIVLEYPGKTKAKPIVLVGKSITFDTGGYSIKPGDSMVGMKYDKSGGMTVIATMVAAARLGLKKPLVGIIAAAENMISGGAYRPNDIVKAMNGKTIEIISADAEGRLVLCDALGYAQKQYKPQAMIDLATLTGGVVVALGSIRAGIMANNDSLVEALAASGEKTYERLWRLPLDDEYFDFIKGEDSDLKNTGVRRPNAITVGNYNKIY
jgi:leucyl aminopeptidase